MAVHGRRNNNCPRQIQIRQRSRHSRGQLGAPGLRGFAAPGFLVCALAPHGFNGRHWPHKSQKIPQDRRRPAPSIMWISLRCRNLRHTKLFHIDAVARWLSTNRKLQNCLRLQPHPLRCHGRVSKLGVTCREFTSAKAVRRATGLSACRCDKKKERVRATLGSRLEDSSHLHQVSHALETFKRIG